MANLNNPSGLSPVKFGTGSTWNQEATLYYLPNDAASTYAIGDIVQSAAGSDANGVRAVSKWLGTVAAGTLPLGVIVGIRVADEGTSLQGNTLSLEKTYLGLAAGAHYVYVVDDPDTIYRIQGDVTAWATTNANQNVNVTITQNQTTLSQSAPLSNTVATAPAVTNSLPLQVLGYVQSPDNSVGAYADLYVRFNVHSRYGAITGRTGV